MLPGISYLERGVSVKDMQERKQIFGKAFLAVSSLATLFVITEIVMQLYGKSLCATEGCKLVSRQVRFGDISMLLIGLVTFFLLTLFSAQSLYRGRQVFERSSNMLLVASLASEGFFTGYQVFSIHRACLLCLVIFGLIVILGILRLLSGEREMLAGFAALAAVFCMFYLILPAGRSVHLPTENRLILFYSKDCRHCTEIMKEFEEKKIPVTHLQAVGYADFLKNMAIESVPTLYVNDQNQKLFLTGTEAIRRYLLACTAPRKPAEKPLQGRKTGKTAAPPQTTAPGQALDIFSQPDLLRRSGEPASPDGLCKEDEVCK